MKKQQGTIYECEYCGKKHHHGPSLSRHEKFCPSMPENQQLCISYCKHLQKSSYNGETSFNCACTGKSLYSYVAEKKGLVDILKRIDPEIERMPTECPMYVVDLGNDPTQPPITINDYLPNFKENQP